MEKGRANKMKIVSYERFGSPDVLELAMVEKPIPKRDEVLVRVHATTMTTAECQMRKRAH